MTSSVETRQGAEKQRLIEALKELPVVQVACKKSGVSRATYYRWKREDREFLRQSTDALAQGIDFINDMSESQLITLIREKKMPAIAMWLKHNNVRYGAKHQSLPHVRDEECTPEEERIVAEALALAFGQSYERDQSTTPQGD